MKKNLAAGLALAAMLILTSGGSSDATIGIPSYCFPRSPCVYCIVKDSSGFCEQCRVRRYLSFCRRAVIEKSAPTTMTPEQLQMWNAQNNYRKACGVSPVVWDAALAANAQAWANGCHQDKSGNFCHQVDTNNCPGAPGNVNGENLAFRYQTVSQGGGPPQSVLPAWTPVEAAKSWYCEARRYPFGSSTPSIIFGGVDSNCQGATGHFTQIVWKSTLRVGCASATCPVSPGSATKGTLWVCEYAPAGNINTPAALIANVSNTCPRQE